MGAKPSLSVSALSHNAVDRTSIANAIVQINDAIQTGSVTLVAGTKEVTVPGGLTAGSVVLLSLVTADGTLGDGVMAKSITPGTGKFTAEAIDTSGAKVVTDESTYAYVVIG